MSEDYLNGIDPQSLELLGIKVPPFNPGNVTGKTPFNAGSVTSVTKTTQSLNNFSCKFKTIDKLLVVSVDDLYDSEMSELIKFLRKSNIPVTLFPHANAKEKILKEMRSLPNARLGWHGVNPFKLDTKTIIGVDRTIIAWSHGKDGDNLTPSLGSDTIARGVHCDREKSIGKFDQHDVPSCSLGDKVNKTLENERKKVLMYGGVLSVHLHYGGRKKGKIGLEELKETVKLFKLRGKIVHFDELKGCGK